VAQNFTSPVTFTVTAEDSTTQAYTATVTVAADTTPAPAPTPAPSSSGGNGAPVGLMTQLPNTNNLSTNTVTITSLQNQLAQLTLQLNSLLSQANITTTYTPYNFTRDLYYRMVGNDVLHLQQYLNTHGFIISTIGAGSPGNETTKFGLLTYKALQRFQTSVELPATGFFGPMTRNHINKK
jgi:hypothetical protein